MTLGRKGAVLRNGHGLRRKPKCGAHFELRRNHGDGVFLGIVGSSPGGPVLLNLWEGREAPPTQEPGGWASLSVSLRGVRRKKWAGAASVTIVGARIV